MSISFSGLASGLDTSSWVEALVSVKQDKIKTLQLDLTDLKSVKTTLNDTRSSVTSLRTALEKLTDAKFGGSFDLFGTNTATSTNKDIFTATATNDAARQSYDITVQQLASFTKAISMHSASAVADDETSLTNLGIKNGTLNVYVDGLKTAIEIEKDETLGDLKSKLADAGIDASVDENGVLKLAAQEAGKTINIGSTTDTTNIVSLLGISKQEDGSYASTNSLYKATTATKLTAEDSGFNEKITEGTFTIGDATFTIGPKTTLSSLISEINKNEKAQASAFWDDATGKLTITSKKEGASYINIEAGTSNFTDVMGLTETERDADGNVVSSRMFTANQTLGNNAIFTINGTSMTSTSNTVTSDVSRLTGVTLTLNKVTTEEDNPATLKVEQNSDGLVKAVESFISAYNNVMGKIDEVTATGANLKGDTSLTSFQRTIRNYANGSNTSNGGAFKLLSELGISTANADGNSLSSDTTSLSLDKDKLLKALEEDPESVKSMLAGENGIFGMMEKSVEQMLSATTGYFDIKQSTLDGDITEIETKITKQNNKISTYRKQLEDRFSNMELMIAQMQQNYSSFLAG